MTSDDYKHTRDAKIKIGKSSSERMKARWANMSLEDRKVFSTKLNKKGVVKRKTGTYKHSKVAKVNIGKAAERQWKNYSQEEREKYLNQLHNSQRVVSSIELLVREELIKFRIEFEVQKAFGNWIVDIYIQKYNLIIECDGDYWHSLPHRIKRDSDLDAWCLKNNYKILHLNEAEIRRNPKEAIIQALKKLQK